MATGQRTTPATVDAPDALSVIRGDAGDAYRYRIDVYRTAHVDNLQARSAEAHAALTELIEADNDLDAAVAAYGQAHSFPIGGVEYVSAADPRVVRLEAAKARRAAALARVQGAQA